ncbi:hypothetical protein GCM10008957_19340 [Deinococcus ruber]|uniref:Uncharacterized protein n=1 Tax=Deinococcus ruber TaxID=1848197 RepID=A0A918F5K4_9DEIO|nr:hypothetical protein GCM10008957_19340 [Deinococcus ruber]
MIGLLATRNTGFGRAKVSGRRRVPKPAAGMIAFMGLLGQHAESAVMQTGLEAEGERRLKARGRFLRTGRDTALRAARPPLRFPL